MDRTRRQEPQPGGGELDRERDAPEVRDDRRDVAGVAGRQREPGPHRRAARDEQADGLEAEQDLLIVAPERVGQALALVRPEAVEVDRRREPGHRVLLLAGDPERRSARGEDPDAGTLRQDRRRDSCRLLMHVLARVEDQEGDRVVQP